MRSRSLIAEQALRLTLEPQQRYVCRSCRAHAQQQRPLHTSVRRQAEQPFWKRMQNGLFGSKEDKKAADQREELTQKKIQDIAEGRATGDKRTLVTKGGQQYEVAALVDPAINKDYVQATSWDGLEMVGSEAWVRARADTGEQYVGFLPRKRVEFSDKQWERLLHHVAVEVLTLQAAGREVDEVCNHRATEAQNWLLTGNAQLDVSSEVPSVRYAVPEDSQTVLDAISRTDRKQAESAVVAEARVTSNLNSAASDSSIWGHFLLLDPAAELAIVKRTMQLTGHRISDHSISSARTLADLYQAFKAKPTPKKLSQTAQLQTLKTSTSNVTVYQKRRTPIDKEKDIGRWKVIEEELLRRDLPVTGSRWQGAKTTV